MPRYFCALKRNFFYSDIIDTVLVGNTQSHMLGYFPIQTKWGDQSYWKFNPPNYVIVNQNVICSISIRLCNELGETIEFESGTVICRLNFRRVGLMRGFMSAYINTYYLLFYCFYFKLWTHVLTFTKQPCRTKLVPALICFVPRPISILTRI